MKTEKDSNHRLQLTVPSMMKARIERVARAKKAKPQAIVLDALAYYLPLADPGLEAEFTEWDQLSDEALLEFEKKLS